MNILDQKGIDAYQESLDRKADSEIDPSFFSGSAGALFDGAANGFVQVASQARAGGYDSDEGAGALMGLVDADPYGPSPEAIRQSGDWASKRLRPDPNTTGMAAEILFSIGDVGTRFGAGFVAGGLPGGALLSGGSVGEERYRELIGEGVEPGAARNAALARGVSTGLGALLPGGVGAGLGVRIASGAAINTAAGAAGRAGEKLALEGTKQAAEIETFGARDIAVDAVLGAVFGGVSRLGVDVSHDQLDAALNLKNAKSHTVDTLPGQPESVGDLARHAQAVDIAIDDILNERIVSIDAESAGVNFRPREPELNSVSESEGTTILGDRPQTSADIVRSVFEEEGYSDIFRAMTESEDQAARIDRSSSEVIAEAPDSIPSPEAYRDIADANPRDFSEGDLVTATREVGNLPANRSFRYEGQDADGSLRLVDPATGDRITIQKEQIADALDVRYDVQRIEAQDRAIAIDPETNVPASELRAKADEGVKSAETEGRAYDAAVECFLSRGN